MTLRGMENSFLLKLPFWVKRNAAMQPRLFARVSLEYNVTPLPPISSNDNSGVTPL